MPSIALRRIREMMVRDSSEPSTAMIRLVFSIPADLPPRRVSRVLLGADPTGSGTSAGMGSGRFLAGSRRRRLCPIARPLMPCRPCNPMKCFSLRQDPADNSLVGKRADYIVQDEGCRRIIGQNHTLRYHTLGDMGVRGTRRRGGTPERRAMRKRKARRANHAGEGWIPVRISLCALGLQQAFTEHSIHRCQPKAVD